LEKSITENTEILKLSIVQLYESFPKIGALAILCFLITLAIVFLLRYIAKIIIVLVLIASSIGCIAITIYLWLKYFEINRSPIDITQSIPLFNIQISSTKLFLILSIISSIVTVIKFKFNFNLYLFN
jgi:hypothetical protein